MSQQGLIDIEGSHPQIPTLFVTDSGNAIPIANTLELLGEVVANAGIPFRSIGSGNTVTYQVQYANETAISDATIVGVAAFDSASFTVDANGFVTLNGGGSAATNIDVDASLAPGTDPVVPNGMGNIVMTGAQVAAGTVGANVIRTYSGAANTLAVQIQRSAAVGATDSTQNGVSHFNSSQFSVDANGFVSLAGGGLAIDSIAVQTGTSPIVPTAAGLVTINGAVVAAGTNPIRTNGTGANTLALEVQIAQATAATDATRIGLAAFDSAAFAVDANGFVTLAGGGLAIDSIGVDATSGGGTNPVLPTVAGLVTNNGAVVAAGTNPIRTVSTAANVYQTQVQISQALAATDATKIGLCNFDSADFAVDANGFVTLAGAGAGQTITGDSGGALSPTGGNWNILGGPGCTTSGSGSTLTVNAITMIDQGSSTTVASDTGYFVTGAFAMTLPASPAQGEIVRVVADTASTVTVTGNTGQIIRVGNVATAAAGSITSTAQGDAITLCYRASSTTWISIGGVGNWNV